MKLVLHVFVIVFMAHFSQGVRLMTKHLLISVSTFIMLMVDTDAAKPNIVFFLVDDLGYMDIGAYNPHTFYETPRVDSIADAGMRFTNGYAANPVCSPSRYALMTGKHPSRPDNTNFFSGMRSGTFEPAPLHGQMDLDEVTLAEVLKENGYATCFAGKWHLGPTEELWPEHQGFDKNIGGHKAGSPPGGYFAPFKNPRLEDGPVGEHLPERLARDVNAWIDTVADKPFFAYVSFYSVHTPLQGRPELIEKYRKKAAAQPSVEDEPEFDAEEQVWPKVATTVRKGKTIKSESGDRQVRIRQRHATYAAMVESMDNAVGAVLDKLKELGLDDNTIICFTSDNGGLSTSEGSPTSNLPLRGGKGWLYEGGIREPFIIAAPGTSQPGTQCDRPVVGMDFYPTLLELASAEQKPTRHLDGLSLVPLLKDPGASLDRKALYWHYPHYSNQGGFPGGVIRAGDLKLVERFEDGRVHLYDLAKDIAERNDIAAENPERVAEMRRDLHNWYREVDAKFLEAKTNGPKPWRPADP